MPARSRRPAARRPSGLTRSRRSWHSRHGVDGEECTGYSRSTAGLVLERRVAVRPPRPAAGRSPRRAPTAGPRAGRRRRCCPAAVIAGARRRPGTAARRRQATVAGLEPNAYRRDMCPPDWSRHMPRVVVLVLLTFSSPAACSPCRPPAAPHRTSSSARSSPAAATPARRFANDFVELFNRGSTADRRQRLDDPVRLRGAARPGRRPR